MKLTALLSERPISFYPVLRKISGSIPSALLLQQLLYWWDKKDGEELYKTIEDIERETSLSRDEQSTAIKRLKSKGFISVKLMGVPAKRHFVVDVDMVEKAVIQFAATPQTSLRQPRKQDSGNPANLLHRLHTEITTESTTLPKGKNEFGSPAINELISFLQEAQGIETLDGSARWNRIYAKNLLKKFKDDTGKVKKFITYALSDPFHGKNATSMKYLYNNVNKIAKTWQANAKKVFIVED
jgi:hypothetical protein